MTKQSMRDVPVAMEGEGFSSRQVEWGGMTFAVEQCDRPMDPAPLFATLPTRRCECPHWGYVIEGSITFRYADHDETVEAGELYYAAPGHIPLLEAPAKLIELSPTTDLRQTVEGINAALAAEPVSS